MKLNAHLGRRLGITTLVILVIFMAIAVSEAILSINRERSAVSHLLQLVSKIEALKSSPIATFDKNLGEIIQLSQTSEYRHIEILITKDDDQILAQTNPSQQANFFSLAIGRAVYAFNRPEPTQSLVKQWRVKNISFDIKPSLISEQSEVGTNLIISIGMLVGFALLLYLGLKLILQKAISPLNESINQLQKLARNQYDGVLNESDIEEVSRINQAINDLSVALIDLEKSRQMLSARIISAQENERANISRELHDELGQKIAVIRLNTGYLGKILSQQDSALVALADINQAIKDIDTELKSLLARLKSNHEFHFLNNKTLKELLTDLIEQWKKSPGQATQFNYSINLGNEHFNSNLSLTVFRITQEALTNIAKHAQAKRVDIKVWSDKRFIYWYIADNGIGIAENLTTSLLKGNGLSGLQERIWSIGGELLINEHNEDKCGLTLEAKIPISA